MTPTPNTEVETKELRVSKSVFDLDSKGEVNVVKTLPDWRGVSTMQEFMARMGNDTEAILSVINDGLEAYDREQLAKNGQPWFLEDEEGNLTPFAGTLLSEKASKSFAATVLANAKMIFGYAKEMVKGDSEANRKAKKAAKEAAQEMMLSNPIVIEALKKLQD